MLSLVKRNIDSLLAAAAGFTIILFFTRHGGIGIEPDSVVYLSVAENLHANGKLVDFAGDPLVDFPAFYPFFLSCIMWLTGLSPLAFAPLLNAFLFALLIFLAGYIMEQFVYTSRFYKCALLACIVVSPCLLEVYSMLMSESLFLVLLLLFFISLHHYLVSTSRKALLAAILFASLASITRYAGITLIATGGILLLVNRGMPLRKKIIDGLWFGLLSPLLLILNLIRNYALAGSNLTGGREISTTPLSENIHDAGSVLYDWLPFLQGNYKGAGFLLIVVMLGLIFLFTRNYRRRQNLVTFENIAASFSLLYLLFMISIASVSKFETLNSRFLAPVFIPLLWCSTYWMVPLFLKTYRPKRKWVLIAGVCVFLLFQYGQLAWDEETWDGVKDAGIPGYTEDQWKYSETVEYIKKDSLHFQKDYTIYSDASDAIYFFTGKVGKFLPHHAYLPGIKEFLSDRHCYVVWFDDGENTDMVDKAFLTGTKKMKLLKQFNDGAVYVYDQ